ncbi:MAG: hypothetical protein WAT23_07175 [Chromatiaceae bacterium]
MNMSIRICWLIALLAVLAAPRVILAADENAADQDLRVQVETYWNARGVNDWYTAYQLEKNPGSDGKPLNPSQYYGKNNSGIRLIQPRIESLTRDGDKAMARVTVTQVMPLGSVAIRVPLYFESYWELIDGNWRHAEMKGYTPEHVLKLREEREAAAAKWRAAKQKSNSQAQGSNNNISDQEKSEVKADLSPPPNSPSEK